MKSVQSNFSSHQPFPREAARQFLIICSVMLSLSSLIPMSAETLQPDTLDFSPSCQTHILEISLYPKSMLWSGKWENVHLYLKHSPIDRSFFFPPGIQVISTCTHPDYRQGSQAIAISIAAKGFLEKGDWRIQGESHCQLAEQAVCRQNPPGDKEGPGLQMCDVAKLPPQRGSCSNYLSCHLALQRDRCFLLWVFKNPFAVMEGLSHPIYQRF